MHSRIAADLFFHSLSLLKPCLNKQSQYLNNDVAWSGSRTLCTNVVLRRIRVNGIHAVIFGKVKAMPSRNHAIRMSVRELFINIKITLDESDVSLLLLPVINLYFCYLAIFTWLCKVAPPLSREREMHFLKTVVICYITLRYALRLE